MFIEGKECPVRSVGYRTVASIQACNSLGYPVPYQSVTVANVVLCTRLCAWFKDVTVDGASVEHICMIWPSSGGK